MLALACQVCPFCVAARAFPKSGYAAFMRRLEENCPACQAYDRVHAPSPGTAEQATDVHGTDSPPPSA